MTLQLADSAVPETRHYWRRLMGLREEFVTDPRSLEEIVSWLEQQR
jgi:hypothetical protein